MQILQIVNYANIIRGIRIVAGSNRYIGSIRIKCSQFEVNPYKAT